MNTFGSANLVVFRRAWVNVGYNFHRFGLGISVDRYGINIDLAFFWFSLDW